MKSFKAVVLGAFILTSIVFSPAKVWADNKQEEAELAELRNHCAICMQEARANRLKAHYTQGLADFDLENKKAQCLEKYRNAAVLIQNAQKLDIHAMETQWTVATIERAIKQRDGKYTEDEYKHFSEESEKNAMDPESRSMKKTHQGETAGAELKITHATFKLVYAGVIDENEYKSYKTFKFNK